MDSSPTELSFPGDAVVKNLLANAGETSVITGWGKSPGGGTGNPLQYSRLEKPIDRVDDRLQSMGPQRVGHD